MTWRSGGFVEPGNREVRIRMNSCEWRGAHRVLRISPHPHSEKSPPRRREIAHAQATCGAAWRSATTAVRAANRLKARAGNEATMAAAAAHGDDGGASSGVSTAHHHHHASTHRAARAAHLGHCALEARAYAHDAWSKVGGFSVMSCETAANRNDTWRRGTLGEEDWRGAQGVGV